MPKTPAGEELSPESLKQLRTELVMIPGVQDVGLEVSNPSSILRESVSAHPDNEFYQEVGRTTYSLTASMIATPEANDQAIGIMRLRYPDAVPINPVWSIDASEWRTLTDGVMGRDILDYCLRSDSLLEVAEEPHEQGWRRAKLAAKNDPNNPYQGWGEKRVKVKDLKSEERTSLGIKEDADPNADVYHPLDAPLKDLDDASRIRNVVPVTVVLNAMADYLLTDDSSIDELVELTDDLISGSLPNEALLVDAAVHIGWMAADMAFGGSAHSTPENYHVFSRLTDETRQLDTDVANAIYPALRSKVLSPFGLYGHVLELKSKKS